MMNCPRAQESEETGWREEDCANFEVKTMASRHPSIQVSLATIACAILNPPCSEGSMGGKSE